MAAEPVDYAAFGPLYSIWARIFSFLAAFALAAAVLTIPALANTGNPALNWLALLCGFIGIAAGFIHGVGFVPIKSYWRYLFGPLSAWPLMLVSAVLWFN
ncbi:cyd operon YbgE family protein [Oceanobacter mangrovi]|uniref:cyd operon YbgE family protein n=1 Tax=Oceanobacter mangrovi TaxID=2862510 RepID=UPI001C8ED346